MAGFLSDDIDFEQYLQETDCKVKVRPASIFSDDYEAEFGERSKAMRSLMTSTKLRNAISFREGEVTVWAGYNGHKKSMLTGQVMLDLCEKDEHCLSISLEMPPRRTLGRMARQAIASPLPSRERWEQFMRWSDGRMWLFDHVGRLNPRM